MARAKIVVIEGTDGCGKETQSNLLVDYLKEKGLKVKKYSFPNYDSPTGKIIGGPYLGKPSICETFFEEGPVDVDPIVSSLYYAADRRYNFLKYIEEELYKNDVIILDRYIMSNMGHQAVKAKTIELRDKILDFLNELEYNLCELPKPDIVIFLHMTFEAAKELRKNRSETDGLESNDEHMKKSEENYCNLAKKYKWHTINCLKTKKFKKREDIKTPEEISKDVKEVVDTLLTKRSVKMNKMTRY